MDMMDVFSTVITGFENVAANEILTKIANVENVEPKRGNVRCKLKPENLRSILKMRSVDNCYVLFYESVIEGLGQMKKEEALGTLRNLVPSLEWNKAVSAWQWAHNRQIHGGVKLVKKQMKIFMEKRKIFKCTKDSPSFRVTCKRAGVLSDHQFSSMDAAWKFGGQINEVFGWKANMKEFDIEIVLRIEQDSVMVMIALNNESLFKRNIIAFGPTTMRSTMCFCMLSIADPAPGEIIVDAMCGGGSIPIEGARAFPSSFFIGGDNHDKAMERCHENLTVNPSGIPCNFIRWNACQMPLHDESVDAIVTDLPFGKKVGSVQDNRKAYPELLNEWKRVLKIGGRLVLMTHDKRSLDTAIHNDRDAWRTDATTMVNVGGLPCLCIRLSKLQ